jgi:sugar phosphate isomerase/epimerase
MTRGTAGRCVCLTVFPTEENPVESEWTRRQWLAAAPAALGAGLAAGRTPAAEKKPPARDQFGYCLNTSTLQGQKLDLAEIVEIAAKAGYQAIEPWVFELEQYARKGGSLRQLGQRIRDRGLTVESAIAFPEWIVDDKDRRRKGMEAARKAMGLVQQIGGKRLAAPPAGATKQADLNLVRAAERYRQLLEMGDKVGVVPQVELWGSSQALGRLGEAVLVAMESGHPRACVLADVYHLYKGGSSFGSLRLLNGAAMHVLHFNDYPAKPPRASITDAQRVYPGDGVAPLKQIVRDLHHIGYRGVLSLELFNREYWKQNALTVARTGLEKMRAVVRAALA